MAFGIFRLIFNVSGNAEPKLSAVSGAVGNLVNTTTNLIPDMQRLGGELTRIAVATRALGGDFVPLSKNMLNMVATGQITSMSLVNLSKQMESMALRSNVVLRNQLQQTSSELQNYAATVRLAEIETRKAGQAQMFMSDVSETTQLRMRQVSAGAQGLMTGMALLQRNIIGLTFSLIFMQFSGFLKLSFGVAALTAALGLAFFKFQDFMAGAKRIRDLQNVFRIVTGSSESFRIATEDAAQVSERWGVELDDLMDIIGVALRDNVRFTTDDLETFAQVLLLMQNKVLPDGERSIAQLIDEFIRFQKESSSTDRVIQRFDLTMEEFNRRLSRIMVDRLKPLQREFLELKRASDLSDEAIRDLIQSSRFLFPGSEAARIRDVGQEILTVSGTISELQSKVKGLPITSGKAYSEVNQLSSEFERDQETFWTSIGILPKEKVFDPLGTLYQNALIEYRERFFVPFSEMWKILWVNNEREAKEALQRLGVDLSKLPGVLAPSGFPQGFATPSGAFEQPEDFPEQEFRPVTFRSEQLPSAFREALGVTGGQNISVNVDVHDISLTGSAEENSNLLAGRILNGISRRGTMTTAPLI